MFKKEASTSNKCLSFLSHDPPVFWGTALPIWLQQNRQTNFCFGNNEFAQFLFWGIHELESDVNIGFSQALHLQCVVQDLAAPSTWTKEL